MRPMALLAMLFGTLDVLNAMNEARAGWARDGGAAWLSSIGAVMIAGVLLIAAGIVLLRRTPASARFARASAIVSMVVFAGVGFLFPWMSVFTRLLGIGYPLVLLLFLLSPSRRRPSALTS